MKVPKEHKAIKSAWNWVKQMYMYAQVYQAIVISLTFGFDLAELKQEEHQSIYRNL